MDLDLYWLQKGDPKQRNMDILDNIYDRAERKITNEISKEKWGGVLFRNRSDRRNNRKGIKEKTLIEEQMERIEEKVTSKFYYDKMFD